MRSNIKQFLLGAIIAFLPMSYLVYKSMPKVGSGTYSVDYLPSSVIAQSFAVKQEITPAPTATPKPTSDLKVKTAVYVVHKESVPEEVNGLIERYATQYGVNKDMMVHIAKCESGFRSNAVNGPYAGIFQFVSGTWVSNRNAMGLDPDPNLRFSAEESVKTAAFKMSRDGYGAWPVCSAKAKNLLTDKSAGI